MNEKMMGSEKQFEIQAESYNESVQTYWDAMLKVLPEGVYSATHVQPYLDISFTDAEGNQKVHIVRSNAEYSNHYGIGDEITMEGISEKLNFEVSKNLQTFKNAPTEENEIAFVERLNQTVQELLAHDGSKLYVGEGVASIGAKPLVAIGGRWV